MLDVHDVAGPVDTLVIEYPSETEGTASASALRDLVDRGIVRLYDLMVIRKDGDGHCAEIDLATVDGSLIAFREFLGARSGLLDTDDVDDLAAVLETDTTAVVLVFENAWAIPFVAAARTEGAEVVAGMRISAQAIMDALDVVDVGA
jgi:hypothetical protein